MIALYVITYTIKTRAIDIILDRGPMKNLFKLFVAVIICTSEVFAMESSNTSLIRVMTYNIRREGKEETAERLWHNRKPLVNELLGVAKPDIIGFQEPTKEQIADIEALLPNFKQFGEGRGESWWGLGDDEYNPIFYNNEKFTLLDSGTFFINKLDTWFGWMPWHVRQTGWLPRICTWGEFEDKQTLQKFYVYNTHFDHMFPLAQLLCARTVVKDIKKRNKEHLPVIVMGDFNTPFAGEMKKIFDAFTHAKEIAKEVQGPLETRTGWNDNELKWIDHILINKTSNPHVQRYEVIAHAGYPSDHRPVFADIGFNKSQTSQKLL